MAFRTATIIFYLLSAGIVSYGQLKVMPIQASKDFRIFPPTSARTMIDSSQIELPFWDDFSTAHMFPDSTKWIPGERSPNVLPGVGVAPPTINVAVFDGWDVYGRPYSREPLKYGLGDSLVSRFIDMTKVPSDMRNTVYISFFWEKEGEGEMPDARDSIFLQLKNNRNAWITVWSKAGPDENETDKFIQEIIQVNRAEFFFPYFQFRFQSYNRLSGGYDTWNIDYVYMNYGRNAADTAYQDRALTSLPSFFLKPYSAIPYDQFIVDIPGYLQPVHVGFYNLHNVVQPIKYTVYIRDSARVYDIMDDQKVLDPNPGGFERRLIYSDNVDPSVFDDQNDTLSLKLETVFYIDSGDTLTFNGKVDYRVNDTTKTMVLLTDQLAYDDGTAEWAVGLSDLGGKIAYRFVVNKPDGITAVRFYFPNFSTGNFDSNFNLMIWKNLRDGIDGRLLVEEHVVQPSPGLNEYVTYELGRPVAVTDTFYVGFEQKVPGFFAVGLDKNTNSGHDIFFNTNGVWEQNTKVAGSIMIRPVFGFKKAVGLREEMAFRGIRVYPNPTTGWVRVEGKVTGITVTDILGRPCLQAGQSEGVTDLDFSSFPNGMYFVKLQREGLTKTFKVVLDK